MGLFDKIDDKLVQIWTISKNKLFNTVLNVPKITSGNKKYSEQVEIICRCITTSIFFENQNPNKIFKMPLYLVLKGFQILIYLVLKWF